MEKLERYLWVDPPRGWAYGFPRVWDTQASGFKEFIEDYGYELEDWHPVRMWPATEEEYLEGINEG